MFLSLTQLVFNRSLERVGFKAKHVDVLSAWASAMELKSNREKAGDIVNKLEVEMLKKEYYAESEGREGDKLVEALDRWRSNVNIRVLSALGDLAEKYGGVFKSIYDTANKP
jgi:hypothetical protein